MPTVKLKPNPETPGGRPLVILKSGKVSCSCCGVCCMYPPQALADGLYSADDLPDSVMLSYDLVENFELTRSGSDFIGVFDPFLTYTLSIAIPPNQTNYEWLIYINGIYDDNLPCLITGAATTDNFADSYTISGPTNGTVTRQSLCVWRGAGLTLTNFGYQWKANGNNKSGFQNTPVGSYAGGYSVS